MIVFGDSSFEKTVGQLVSSFSARAGRVRHTDPSDVQLLRTLLIEAGQVEQAVADEEGALGAASWRQVARCTMAVTDACATLMLLANSRSEAGEVWFDAERVIQSLVSASLRCREIATRAVRVKCPEGFAFYSLFPEQYIESASRWMRGHATEGPSRVLVIGVRSIGTSLSAIVKATLCQNGWSACRITLRPTGDPLDRRTDVPPNVTSDCSYALVVDEGPGLSGSSMASVARALVDAGFRRDRVTFFPGSPNQPGSAASGEVRKWWRETPRVWTPLERTHVTGKLFCDQLNLKTSELTGTPSAACESVGGGIWRRLAFSRESDWPGVVPTFERQKYVSQLGSSGGVLWKFAGMSTGPDDTTRSASELRRLDRLASQRLTPEPLGSWNGYLATTWIDGTRLQRARYDMAHLHRVATYLNASTEPPMNRCEAVRGLARLQCMLHQNTLEALGTKAATSVQRWSDEIGDGLCSDDLASYPDGRLAPHEWVQDSNGLLLKTDAAGHSQDHTVVGRQLLAWDMAGLAVEWAVPPEDLTSPMAMLPTDPWSDIGDIVPSCEPAVIAFHIAAYCAFRIGMCTLGIETTADHAEQARLRQDRVFYVNRLRQSLCRHRLFHDDGARAVDAQHPRAT